MAADIGVKVKIDGFSQFKSEMQQITQSQKTLKSEMQAVSSAWDKNTSAEQKNAAAKKNLAAQIEAQEKKVEKLGEMLGKVEAKYGANSREALSWKEALNNATAELNNLESKLKEVPGGLEQLSQGFKDSGEKIKGVGDGIKGAGEAFAPVSAAAGAALGASAKLAIDFENSMAKVSTIADTTAVPLESLEKEIMNLSNQTGISASEIANNVYDAISAGQKTGDAVSFVENATTLAKAGFTSSSSALDILTTAMNAYGLEADEVGKVSDVLITTQNLGKTTVDQLASSMGKVIPTAKSNGVELEQLAGAYAVMTSNGIATAETTTYLNSMMNELGKSGSSAEKAFREGTSGIKEGGLSMKEAMESGMSLTDVLKILDEQAKANGTSISNMFGSAEAGKAANVLLDNSQKLDEAITAMGSSAGATDAAFAKLDTTSNQANIALNQIKNSGIELGNSVLSLLAPAMEGLATKISELSTWFSNLDPSTKQMIATIGLVVAAVTPVLVIIGTVIGAIGSIVSVIGSVISAIGAVVAVIGGPLTLAIAAAIAIGALVIANWDKIKAKAIELGAKIKEKFAEIKEAIVSKFTEAKTKAIEIWESIKTSVTEKINALKASVTAVVDGIKAAVSEKFSAAKQAAVDAWEAAKSAVTEKVQAMKDKVSETVQGIKDKVTEVMEGVKNAFQEKIDAAKELVRAGIEAIKGFFNITLEFPKIKLPHFKVSGSFSMNPPSVPSFSVDWYAKAMKDGMILNNPTIFGMQNGRLLGAGEAGPEVVVGASSLFGMIKRAVGGNTYNSGGNVINVYGAPGQDVKELAREIANLIQGDVDSKAAVWG